MKLDTTRISSAPQFARIARRGYRCHARTDRQGPNFRLCRPAWR